ncbi:efflux RND transporter periplasmic adaptor subunit [Salmonella enterica]|nr:efflux RND transporter periplasmic adaptor subunit [Salmonella enterica]ECQ6494711.1 efflux RND transporter periplasmic adaptor subunit [Salmonella enterica subsp. houtenae]EAW4385171.1 efflux RND transporter periplasmic adaptor subunit [Salmonella enterica]EAX9733678.1 efflux RND transporter periplasmic adaptor subunit [Salmonella enterica]EBA6027255.1 efflux RND transporter periplasmic adaptor subunit [Salmonella enterica]
MSSKAKAFCLSAVLVVVCFGIYLTVPSSHEGSVQGFAAQSVIRGDIKETVMLTGIVKPFRKVKVGAQVTGQLKRLYVQDGQHVKQGELLAEIDPSIQEADLKKAEASLSRALAQQEAAKVLLWQYQAEYRRQQNMKRDDATPEKTLEQAKSQYESQIQQVRIEEASVVQAQMEVESAKTNLSYTKIHAPMDGEVLAIVTEEGQTIVSSQTATTILILADLSKVSVGVNIPEVDILKIHTGQSLSFYTLADAKKVWQGKMGKIQSSPDDINKEDDPSTSSSGKNNPIYYTGTFEVDNACRCFKTSMTTNVFVTSAEAKNVLLVPLAALSTIESSGKDYVRKKVNDQIIDTPVTVGLQNESYAEITSGLSEKDLVIVNGPGKDGNE